MRLKLFFILLIAVTLLAAGLLPPVFSGVRSGNATVQADGVAFLYPDKWGGNVGTVVTVRCRGFTPGKVINFSYSFGIFTETLASEIADANGECNVSLTIPPSSRGVNYIVARDDAGQSATAAFTVVPALQMTPQNVTVGDELRITGTGFVIGDEVVVSINGLTAAQALVADSGTFIAVLKVPPLSAGVNIVGIHDTTGDIRWLELNVSSELAVNKIYGEVGARVTLTGNGFNGGARVQIKWDSTVVDTTAADTGGRFSVGFTVPVSSAGYHIISVTDGVNTQQVTFTIESVPPSVPELLSPKQKQSVASPVFFDWGSVYDPSEPVSYEIQVAHDKNFTAPVLIRKALSQSQYTLNDGEELLPNRRWNYYYWRVRASDSAGNVSGWSDTAAFHVSPENALPGWATFCLITLQVVICGGFVITLARILNPPQKKTGS